MYKSDKIRHINSLVNRMGIVARDSLGQFATGSEAAAAARRVQRALERALAQDDWSRLHRGMDKLANSFADGAPWALEMVMSRLAGKPTQRIETANAEARELDLAAVMQIIIEHRKLGADDVQAIDSTAVPAPAGDPDPAGTP